MSKRPSQHRAKALRAPARSRLGTPLIPEARPQRPARLQMHLGRRRHFARRICCTISTNLLLDMHREDSAPLCEASLQGAFRVNLQQQKWRQRLRLSIVWTVLGAGQAQGGLCGRRRGAAAVRSPGGDHTKMCRISADFSVPISDSTSALRLTYESRGLTIWICRVHLFFF